jgi:hypothetical protein
MGLPNGSFQFGSGRSFESILDGLSNTLLGGEKHVPLNHFGEGWLDSSIYNGQTYYSCTRPAGPDAPLAKTMTENSWSFGSYHPTICQFVLADGSVRSLPVTIDPKILGRLAEIADGQGVPDF